MSTEKKKLLYIIPVYDASTDTHFAYLYPFIALLARDIDVFVLIERLRGKIQHGGFEHRRVIRSSNVLFRTLEELVAVVVARFRGYKDVYVHYSFSGALVALLVTKIFGGRVFYWNCGMPWLYKRRGIRERVFRYILRHAILVTGAESLRDQYVEIYQLNKKRTRILPNWIDLNNIKQIDKDKARKELGIDKTKRVVLFVHHLSKRKGSDMIVPVANNFKNKKTLFLIVGDGPYLSKLKQEVTDNDLGDVVRIAGRVPQRDISTYFAVADVFFMPSEEEGFPHVILEALAYGTPYVSSDVGAVREMSPVSQHRFVLSERTPESFTDGLEKIAIEPPSSDQLRKHARLFDLKETTARFVSFF